MWQGITDNYNKIMAFSVSEWMHKNPAKASSLILMPGEAAMAAGGIFTYNPMRFWTGVLGLKAAVSSYVDGDTIYNTTESHPLLKANPSFVPGGVSDWSGWSEGNVRQYSVMTVSGGLGTPIDIALSLPGIAAFKALTIKDPAKQVFQTWAKLDEIAYKPENVEPINFRSTKGLRAAFIDAPQQLITLAKQDFKDLAAFTRNHAPGFFAAIPGSFVERSKNLASYVFASDSQITRDLREWGSNWKFVQSTKDTLESEAYKNAGWSKSLYWPAFAAYAANDTAEKLTDVAMLPFKAIFKVLEKPSEEIAEAIRRYGIERRVDGKKAISERLQNYSEIPYMMGGLGFLGWALATGASGGTTAMASLIAATGMSYAVSNAYQRKSGNVPGMDLDLPIYLHKPQDIDAQLLHGIDDKMPRYKELVEAIKVVLASEKNYIEWLETTMRDNPGAIFEMNSDGTYKLDPEPLREFLEKNQHITWEKKDDGSYNLDNAGFTKLKDPTVKISISQIVGLPDLRDWPQDRLPLEAENVIREANEMKAQHASGKPMKGRLSQALPRNRATSSEPALQSYARTSVMSDTTHHFLRLDGIEKEVLQKFWQSSILQDVFSLDELAQALNDESYFISRSFPGQFNDLRNQMLLDRNDRLSFMRRVAGFTNNSHPEASMP